MTRNTIVMYLGQSQYDAITGRMKLLAQELAVSGRQVEIRPITEPANVNPKDVAFQICPQGWRPELTNRAFALDRPIVAIAGDHPAYAANRYLALPQGSVFLATMRISVNFMKAVRPDLTCIWWPPAMDSFQSAACDKPKRRVVFAGSKTTIDLNRDNIPPAVKEFVEPILKKLHAEPEWDPFLGTLSAYIRNNPEARSNVKVIREVLQVASIADQAYRAQLRMRTLESLKGFPLDVVGNGWRDAFQDRAPQWRFHDPQPLAELRHMYGRYDFVLNIFPHYYDWHGRVFHAIGAGALPITPTSAAAREAFDDTADIALYPADTDKAADRIAGLLDMDETERQRRVDAAHKIATAGHTFAHRAKIIMDQAQKRGWLD